MRNNKPMGPLQEQIRLWGGGTNTLFAAGSQAPMGASGHTQTFSYPAQLTRLDATAAIRKGFDFLKKLPELSAVSEINKAFQAIEERIGTLDCSDSPNLHNMMGRFQALIDTFLALRPKQVEAFGVNLLDKAVWLVNRICTIIRENLINNSKPHSGSLNELDKLIGEIDVMVTIARASSAPVPR